MNRFKSALFSAGLGLIAPLLSAQNCAPQRYADSVTSNLLIRHDIPFAAADPYGIIGSQELKLDLYEPLGDTLAKRPLIVFSFGGAFLIGDKSQPFIPDFCKYFAKHGYVTAAITYRIGFNTLDQGSAERAAYRAVQDIRAALRFFAEFSQAFRIDTNNIFLAGTSAGCVASLHSVFMTEQDRPASTYGTLLEPQNLGCANCSGNNLYGNRDVPVKAVINCWGAMLDTLYISDFPHDSVPVISFHGTNDLIVPYIYGNPFQLPIFPPMYGSYSIHQRLQHEGVYNLLKPLNGAGHEPELLNWAYADTIFQMTRDFLFEILKPKTSGISGPTSACSGKNIFYSVPATATSRYCWEAIGGNVVQDLGNAVEVQWTDTGMQQIKVREINYLDAAGDEKILNVHVTQQPSAGYFITQYEKMLACQNQSYGATQQLWDFGDGTTSSDIHPSHTYASPGTYTVKLKVSNGDCADSTSVEVTMIFCPVADFDFTAEGLSASFTDISDYATSAFWDFGDGDTGSYNNPVHQYAAAGTYSVQLIATNSIGCKDTVSKSITMISTGNKNPDEEITMEVFPNPTEDFIFIRLPIPSHEKTVIEIFSITGECIYKAERENLTSETVHLRPFPAGLYNLRLVQGKTQLHKKIVKL